MQYQLAGFWRRFAAYIVDLLILSISILFIGGAILGVANILAALLYGSSPISGVYYKAAFAFSVVAGSIALIVNVVGCWLYFARMESSLGGATLGKRLLGIRVVDLEGAQISFAKASVRTVTKILSGLIFYVGFLMVAFTPRKQGLHDSIAKTLVVKSAPAEMAFLPTGGVSVGAVLLSIAASVGIIILTLGVVALLVYLLGGNVHQVFSNVVTMPD